ncbi:MAG: DegV family protein [Anaerolineaceae bacterium]|nr:DegV family protein [Anaerolineaceae bacterium]
MNIVTDSGADISFEECKSLGITMLPLKVEVNGVSYQSGVDIDPDEFYDLMDASPKMPITSTPSVGEFEEPYKRLAAEDPEILSIHLSSGLSGTFNAAVQAAEMVPEAKITLIDTLTLSAGTGWQLRAAAAMVKAGCSMEEVVKTLRQIQDASSTFFTLPDLKYLIAGGRISHLKGLLASLLGIKPVIEVSKVDGKYYDKVKKRSFQQAIDGITELIKKIHPVGTEVEAQIVTAANPSGAEQLKASMEKAFKCEWKPTVTLGTALGAHTGRGLVGVICAAKSALPTIG